MFCRKCGEKIPADSIFCPACGDKLTPGTKFTTPMSSPARHTAKSSININSTRPVRNGSIACTVVILLLTFTRWFNAELFGFSESFSILGVIDMLSQYAEAKYIEISPGFLSFILITSSLIIIIACGLYLYKELTCDTYENNSNIVYGYNAMNIILVIFAVDIIALFIVNALIDVIEITFTLYPYILCASALLNRFLILPKYTEIRYYNIELLQKHKNQT